MREDEARAEWPGDLRWAWGVLRGETAAAPQTIDPELGAALIEELIARKEVAILTTLARGQDKRVVKAARTALHRLRSQKVAVELPTGGGAPRGTGKVLAGTEPLSFVTAYNDWTLDVMLAESGPGGDLEMVMATVSAETGLERVMAATEVPRRELRHIRQRYSEHMPLAALPRDEAAWLIHAGARRRRRSELGLPEGWGEASGMLGPAPRGEHPALTLIAPAEATAREMEAVFEHPALRRWIPDRETMERLMLRLDEVLTSQLVVDEDQRRQQWQNALDRAAAGYFDAGRRAAARQVLLDTALLLHHLGQAAAAKRALAAARAFEQAADPELPHPLWVAFFSRLLPGMEELQRRMDDELSDEGSPLPPDGLALPPEPDEAVSEGGLIIPGGRMPK